MTRIALIAAAACLPFFVAPAVAQDAPLNNEFICSQPGYRMDPRCEGGSSAGWLVVAQNSINNEAVCTQPGYRMDPRCVGE